MRAAVGVASQQGSREGLKHTRSENVEAILLGAKLPAV